MFDSWKTVNKYGKKHKNNANFPANLAHFQSLLMCSVHLPSNFLCFVFMFQNIFCIFHDFFLWTFLIFPQLSPRFPPIFQLAGGGAQCAGVPQCDPSLRPGAARARDGGCCLFGVPKQQTRGWYMSMYVYIYTHIYMYTYIYIYI